MPCWGQMSLNVAIKIKSESADAPKTRWDGDAVFHQAYETVRQRYEDEAWATLEPRERTRAIYSEMRRLDAARASARPLTPAWLRLAKVPA
jgi:hypothetical protein